LIPALVNVCFDNDIIDSDNKQTDIAGARNASFAVCLDTAYVDDDHSSCDDDEDFHDDYGMLDGLFRSRLMRGFGHHSSP
jgi:hypothetical protein